MNNAEMIQLRRLVGRLIPIAIKVQSREGTNEQLSRRDLVNHIYELAELAEESVHLREQNEQVQS